MITHVKKGDWFDNLLLCSIRKLAAGYQDSMFFNNSMSIPKFGDEDALKPCAEDVYLLHDLVYDIRHRGYDQLSKSKQFAAEFALLYLKSSIDLIPDFIPVIGLVDDKAVIASVMWWLESDLQDYVNWKENNPE